MYTREDQHEADVEREIRNRNRYTETPLPRNGSSNGQSLADQRSGKRPVIRPVNGETVTLTLDGEPREIETQYGPQWMYGVNGNQAVLFTNKTRNQAIQKAGAQQGDTIAITVDRNGRWSIEICEDEPMPAASKPAKQTRIQGAQSYSHAERWPLADTLEMCLRNAWRACNQFASAEPRFTFDAGDVRTLATTLFINVARGER